MATKTGQPTPWKAAMHNNTARLAIWTFAWVLTTAVASFGPKLVWNYQTGPTILAVLVNLAAGAVMIAANRRHLLGLDELQRKIFLDAGALTLGVGLVAGLSYEMLKGVRLIAFEPKISHLVILMSITFLARLIAGHRQYR